MKNLSHMRPQRLAQKQKETSVGMARVKVQIYNATVISNYKLQDPEFK